MRKPLVKPLVISPIPATFVAPAPRPMSLKRLSRVRLSWFVVGSLFGVGISFFMNFVITMLVIPEYQAVMARHGEVQIAEGKEGSGVLGLGFGKKETDEEEEKQAASAAKPQSPIPNPAVAANQPPIPNPQSPAAQPPISYPRTLALVIGKGDTLLDMLIANHVQTAEAHQVVEALKPQVNPKNLRVGQQISVTLARHETLGDKAAVKELAIHLPNLSLVELQRLDNGKFNVAATKETLTAHAYRGFGKVRTSLSQAGADAAIPNAAMNELVKAFSYDVDFQRDIHPGDTLEVLIDRKTTRDGRVGGYGDLRYAALTLRGTKHEIFRAKDAFGDYAWFDAKGNSIKKSLLRTPVEAAHITSGFGMRMHPLLGYTKFHRGVDFGAPTGTPIMAAGSGVVEFKGWQTGYGNFVLLRHNATYETAYGHISRFANIKVGQRVKQGQVIAYVGMTGMATGPHLHYEVRQNDTQVDPVSKQFNMASGLTGKPLAVFKATKATVLKELASLSKPDAQVASR